MTKNEFLSELRSCLKGLPKDECDAAVSYYEEFFDEAGEENVQDVIIQLGTPKALAESILAEQSFSSEEAPKPEYIPMTGSVSPKAAKKNDGGKIALIIVLCVIFSPVILGLGGTALGVITGIAGAILGIVLAFGATAVVLGLVGLVLFGLGITQLPVLPWDGVALLGSSLIVLAFAMVFLLLFVLMCGKLIPAIIRGIVNLFHRLFYKPTPAMA